MKEEKCSGAVIVKRGKVLLVYQENGFWGFPKGHMEKSETEEETAKREVEEETGLRVEIEKGKKVQLEYIIKDKRMHKTVVLFAAKVLSGEIRAQKGEIARVEWVDREEVENRLTFPEWKEAWREMEKKIWVKSE